jgi:putative membrane protein insertion efficiency factor
MMRKLLVMLVRAYQLTLGVLLPASCRYSPTCSSYAIDAVQRHGAIAGSYLAARRIARCGPWCAGGDDPVPLEKPRLFTHFTPTSKNNS